MNELKSCCIVTHMGAEMHTDSITKWQFNCNIDETTIKNEVKYKVWFEVCEKKNPIQPQPYTCEVFWLEEVPQQIIEAEELVRNYWALKEPKKGIRGSGF